MRTTCGISSPFELLFPASGQVTYVLRTHSPLNPRIATRASFDLHVLSTPPAFILSQDQTLRMTSSVRRLTWRLLIDCRVHDPAVGSTIPRKGQSPQAAYHGASSYHSSVVKVPHFPRETKNRCKPLAFASAQVQARSLGCTVCPAHGGLNDLLADYTQAGGSVKGNGEFESILKMRVAVEREA